MNICDDISDSEESKREASIKFKMMMIGDLCSYKSELMAKYFNKNPEEIIMALTEKGFIKGTKRVEVLKKYVKVDCLDTT
jgi:RNA:NAD 2'-phosphotransferase (TPT1/KptA family)